MATTTTTTLEELKVKSTLSTIKWVAAGDIWGPLVSNEIIPVGSSSHILPVLSSPTAAGTPGEANAVTAKALDSGITPSITPVELVEEVDITNHVINQIPQNIQDATTKFLGDAIAAGKNALIESAAQMWTQNDVCLAGTALSTAAFEKALQYLAAAKAPGPYYFVSGAKLIYGPKGITTKLYGLSSNEYALTSGTNVDNFSKTGYVAMTYGFRVYLDPAIVPDVNDDIHGYFFASDALAWGEQVPLNVDIDYLVQTRTHVYVATLWGGASTYIDSHGAWGHFDVA